MPGQALNARSATLIVNSPLRHATGALAVSAGFAYVLEAEDQFHRSVWFGVVFAGLTGAWFILGSFLALIDTIAVWWAGVVLVVLALGLWAWAGRRRPGRGRRRRELGRAVDRASRGARRPGRGVGRTNLVDVAAALAGLAGTASATAGILVLLAGLAATTAPRWRRPSPDRRLRPRRLIPQASAASMRGCPRR